MQQSIIVQPAKLPVDQKFRFSVLDSSNFSISLSTIVHCIELLGIRTVGPGDSVHERIIWSTPYRFFADKPSSLATRPPGLTHRQSMLLNLSLGLGLTEARISLVWRAVLAD